MQTHYYTTIHGTLAYYTWGSGKKPLVCLHGYGELAENFRFLEPHLAGEFSVLCIDFPHHGNSQWVRTTAALLPQELIQLIQQVFGEQKFTLLAYSMGGRVALQLLQVLPKQLEKVVLLAPDGFHKNFWQRFATQTSLGQKVFKGIVKNPRPVYYVLKRLVRFQLFNKSVYKFADSYLHIPEVRQELYKRWMVMRKFQPQLNTIQKNIQQYPITITLVFGKYDRIIVAKHGYTFVQQCGSKHIQLIEWSDGHQLLKPKHAPAIAKLLTVNVPKGKNSIFGKRKK